MFYVYIIHSEKFDNYYVGSSQNPWKRIEKHNTSPFNSFTSKYRPWKLKAVFEAGVNRGEAEKIEKFIKKQKSKILLMRLVDSNFVANGKLAQLVIPYIRDARAGLIRGSRCMPSYSVFESCLCRVFGKGEQKPNMKMLGFSHF